MMISKTTQMLTLEVALPGKQKSRSPAKRLFLVTIVNGLVTETNRKTLTHTHMYKQVHGHIPGVGGCDEG